MNFKQINNSQYKYKNDIFNIKIILCISLIGFIFFVFYYESIMLIMFAATTGISFASLIYLSIIIKLHDTLRYKEGINQVNMNLRHGTYKRIN